eukprot:UN09093
MVKLSLHVLNTNLMIYPQKNSTSLVLVQMHLKKPLQSGKQKFQIQRTSLFKHLNVNKLQKTILSMNLVQLKLTIMVQLQFNIIFSTVILNSQLPSVLLVFQVQWKNQLWSSPQNHIVLLVVLVLLKHHIL